MMYFTNAWPVTPERQLDLFEKVAAIEASGRIDGLEWKGLNLWVLFRFELLGKVLRGEGVSIYQDQVLSSRLSWRERLSLRRQERKLGKQLAQRLQQVQVNARLLLLSESDQHYAQLGTGRYNRHLDPYLEAAIAAGIATEKIHAYMQDPKSTHRANVLFDDQDMINDYLWLGQKLAGTDAPDMAWRIGQELDVNVGRVMNHATHIRQWMELLSPWVENQGFEAIGISNYHNCFTMALIEAARMHNRPTFDIQHGKIGSLNFSYSSFSQGLDRVGSLLPDGHWIWNADAARNVQKEGYPFRCAVGGNVWFNKNREQEVGVLSEEEQQWLERLKAARQSLLMCAQPQQDYVLPDFLEGFALAHPEVEIGVRLHPRQINDEIPGLDRLEALPNVNVKEATSLFLFAALREVDIVATRWSTVALEARLFGKRAWIIDPFGVTTFKRFIQEGHMTPALDLSDWESALTLPDPPKFPADMAPHLTTEQYRSCFEFLIQPLSQRTFFDPTAAS